MRQSLKKMTIQELKSKLLNHFMRSDSFDIACDMPEIDLEISLGMQQKLYVAALKDLAANGIIHEIDQSKIWVLEKPLLSWDQSVSIDGSTINAICQILTEYSNTLAKGSIVAPDPLRITNDDIQSLIKLFNSMEALKLDQTQEKIKNN